MTPDSRWLFLTVGAGSREFEEAADRISKQALKFKEFDSVVCVKTGALVGLFPELNLSDSEKSRGFGYYRWKSKVVNLALTGHWGSFDGVCFVDAGCEINFNLFSELSLLRTLQRAEACGVVAYAISTPERGFTKRKVLEYFDAVQDYSNQFQSGTIFLHGQLGRKISQDWDRLSNLDISFSDDSPSPGGEFSDFFEHRHDQSILSLILKDLEINPSPKHPPGSPRSWRFNFVNISSPVWWSRNRSGNSTLRGVDFLITRVSQVSKSICKRVRILSAVFGKNYIYLRLGGGLGNQLHQYSAAKALSEELGKQLVIDLEGIAKSDHGIGSNATHFNLSAFLVNSKILSTVFRFKRRIYNRLRNTINFKSVYIASTSGYVDDLLTQSQEISYLEGYFHTHKYSAGLSRHSSESDLLLRDQTSKWFQEMLSELRHKKVCAVHVRRGDYLKTWKHYGVLSSKYYEQALIGISASEIDEYWIFSDAEVDMSEWSFLETSKIKTINPPHSSSAAESLVLMSRARWIITANSTFSWWAGFLYSLTPKTVIAPSPFFRSGQEILDLYPQDWLIVPAQWIDF